MSGRQALKLSKNVNLGGDDEAFMQMAAGRRKLHFSGLPDEMLRQHQGSVSSDGAEEESREKSISDYDDDSEFFLKAFDHSEVEKTCIVAMATVKDIPETTGDTIKEELRDYLQEVFALPNSRMQVLQEQAETEECPDLKLSCKVLNARGLTAKDADGKSDPYCRLGILNQKHLETCLIKHKNLDDWMKEGVIEEVVATSIKPSTLEPEWNETLELVITNTQEDVLVLEVWDSDSEDVQNSKGIKGLKGFGNFLTDLRKGVDDFMGRLFQPLHYILASGETKTLHLYSHSGRSKHGFISISLNIRGIKEHISIEVSIWEHTMLTRAMVNQSSRNSGKNYSRHWDGKLPPIAERLLEQHSMYNGLHELHLAAIRLSVLSKYHKLYAVKTSTLRSLLQDIKKHKSLLPKQLTPADIKPGGSGEKWIIQMFSDLLELASDTEELLKNHLNIYNIHVEEDVRKIEENLVILKELYSYRPFVYQLPMEKRNLKDVLEKCIQDAIPNWFHITRAKLLPQTQTPELELQAFKTLSEHCLHLGQVVLKKLDHLFMEEGVSYFSHFYVAMDNLLGDEAQSVLNDVESNSGTAQTTFEIYVTFRSISKLSDYVNKNMKDAGLQLRDSHTWFRRMVRSWISLAIDRCTGRIKKAIELNETITEKVMISTSAIDTTGFLLSVGEFWKHLDWPDASISYGLMVAMVQKICDCAQYYVRELYESIDHKYDIEGKFLTSEKLSIALNNMHHIRTVVSQLPEKLDLQSFYDWLEEEEEKLGGSANDIVSKVLSSTDDDFDNKIRQIVEDVSLKLSPDILKYIDNMISSQSDLSDDKVVTPLLDYLSLNLQTLGDYTYTEIFFQIILPIWRVCVSAVKQSLNGIKHKKEDCTHTYQRLMVLLETLRHFFNADSNGLNYAEMDDDTYQEVVSDLKTLKLESHDLTLHFFSDLVRLQNQRIENNDRRLGELLMSLRYNRHKSALDVHVIQGRGLPIMDKIGSSDPYVVLTILPQWKYVESNKKTYKTHVEKSTLEPYFNKEFIIPLSHTHATLGGIILFTVFDHDLITSNDFMGVCAVDLTSIPGSSPSSSPSSSHSSAVNPINLTLPLFTFAKEDMITSLSELVSRSGKGDSIASNFFKVNKKILGKSSSLF